MKYSEIKTLEEIDEAHKAISRRLKIKGEVAKEELQDIRDSFTFSHLFMAGLKNASSIFPVDKILLIAILKLKSYLSK